MTLTRRTTSLPIALFLCGLAALSACTAADVGTLVSQAKPPGTPAPSGSSKPAGTDLSGNLDDAKGKSPSPPPDTAGGATPTPVPTPTPRPSPTPSPTAIPYTGFSVEVTVTPATASINLKDPDNPSSSLYPVSATLAADVLMSDNTHASAVTWSSSDEQVASVNASGVVTAGTKKGTATIVATAEDGQASGSSTITVEDGSALDVTIN